VFRGIGQTVVHLELMCDTLDITSGNFNCLVKKALGGKGTVAAFINDTTIVHDLNNTVLSIKGAADGFSSNIVLLLQSRLLKRYFKHASEYED